MNERPVCELPKNARETICFRLGEFKGHKFIDMRIFTKEDGKDPAPTKKGLAVSPQLWPQFRAALAQVEAAMIEAGWIDKEDLQAEGDIPFLIITKNKGTLSGFPEQWREQMSVNLILLILLIIILWGNW